MILTEIKRHDLIAYGEVEFGEHLVSKILETFFLAMSIKALRKRTKKWVPQNVLLKSTGNSANTSSFLLTNAECLQHLQDRIIWGTTCHAYESIAMSLTAFIAESCLDRL